MEQHLVTLTEMLEARERRAFRQRELFKRYPFPMICFTMNIAGPVKDTPLIRQGFALGKRYLKEHLDVFCLTPVCQEEYLEPTGNEAYYLIDEDPYSLKKITCAIEDSGFIGRLLDMDVLTPSGMKIDRTELGLLPRSCLICGKPAKECSRSRSHSIEELQLRTTKILEDAINERDSADAARLALKAILYEVCTTPKPGLVDRANSGSHKDMDIFTFMDSASTLWPYFQACSTIGRKTSAASPQETLRQLRTAGRNGEAAMFSATKGVNTHKGAIFSMGILCAALGRLPRKLWKQPDAVLDECASMAKGLTEADFAGLTLENARTVGQKLYLQYGITGIRGQMEEGLPAVRKVGLPVLKEGIARKLTLNDAGCAALLALITAATDTNLISRGSLSLQQEISSRLKTFLEEDPYPAAKTLRQIDAAFTERNLSPGGSADLLAACYFLYFLETED